MRNSGLRGYSGSGILIMPGVLLFGWGSLLPSGRLAAKAALLPAQRAEAVQAAKELPEFTYTYNAGIAEISERLIAHAGQITLYRWKTVPETPGAPIGVFQAPMGAEDWASLEKAVPDRIEITSPVAPDTPTHHVTLLEGSGERTRRVDLTIPADPRVLTQAQPLFNVIQTLEARALTHPLRALRLELNAHSLKARAQTGKTVTVTILARNPGKQPVRLLHPDTALALEIAPASASSAPTSGVMPLPVSWQRAAVMGPRRPGGSLTIRPGAVVRITRLLTPAIAGNLLVRARFDEAVQSEGSGENITGTALSLPLTTIVTSPSNKRREE